MNEQGHLEILNLTPDKEKIERLDSVLAELMHKYFELVWLVRTDKEALMEAEKYEILKRVKEIEEQYPKEVKELDECETNWQHGFNSGMLACTRFISSYIQDDWWPLEDTGGVEFPEDEIQEINGRKYVQFDGREQALELFPELDT